MVSESRRVDGIKVFLDDKIDGTEVLRNELEELEKQMFFLMSSKGGDAVLRTFIDDMIDDFGIGFVRSLLSKYKLSSFIRYKLGIDE